MLSRIEKLALWGSIALLVICALSVNIALPMTVQIVDEKTGQPIEGAFVVSYLAIRHLPHNFDDGKSVIQEAVSDANGDAKFKLSVSWIFVNGFQDYNSKILVFKPGFAPKITMNAFNVTRVFMSFASIKTKDIQLARFTEDSVERKKQLDSLAGELTFICLKGAEECNRKHISKFGSAFRSARSLEYK
jgi:hypothetical protein